MFNYVQIENGIVIGVQQSTREINTPSLISIESYDMSLIGRTYQNGRFGEKEIIEVSEITLDEFRSRFTFDEKVRIESSTDAGVKALEKDLNARALAGGLIRLKSQQLIDGIEYYRAQGLLDNDNRAQEILKPASE